ncbi:recombination mediator RecR [Aureibacter tunicatorum]|uniref:Recombination protein RecR n=1 Tax=Aureibacter tunicatorum TaxID=866807 RepID=A0AAE3XKT9_9BACT|nr:recombination mediator RecR [Aureibacter tunicatorum]MDR6237765.1 recombination protein RecR [Aureibacter tunicatorum]BDD02800.1 recombination protein RecR [Aureibacter tunicatorum]
MQLPSKLIQDAVEEMAKLPGIGKKTALRLVLHLLNSDKEQTTMLSNALVQMRENVKYCKKCHNVSDEEICNICSSNNRDKSTICVVESIKDVLAIENTAHYRGEYHVLGGIISPLEGIGPSDLSIDLLIERVSQHDSEVKEVILALSPTMEGDTTAFYISKKLKSCDIKLSTIARGVPIGGEIEYTDEVTLGRSIMTRTLFS